MYEQNVEWINTLEESVVGILIQICILLLLYSVVLEQECLDTHSGTVRRRMI